MPACTSGTPAGASGTWALTSTTRSGSVGQAVRTSGRSRWTASAATWAARRPTSAWVAPPGSDVRLADRGVVDERAARRARGRESDREDDAQATAADDRDLRPGQGGHRLEAGAPRGTRPRVGPAGPRRAGLTRGDLHQRAGAAEQAEQVGHPLRRHPGPGGDRAQLASVGDAVERGQQLPVAAAEPVEDQRTVADAQLEGVRASDRARQARVPAQRPPGSSGVCSSTRPSVPAAGPAPPRRSTAPPAPVRPSTGAPPWRAVCAILGGWTTVEDLLPLPLLDVRRDEGTPPCSSSGSTTPTAATSCPRR